MTPIEETRELRKWKKGPKSRNPEKHAPIATERISSSEDNPMGGKTSADANPQLPHDNDTFGEMESDYGEGTHTDSSAAVYAPSGSDSRSVSGESAELSFSEFPTTRVVPTRDSPESRSAHDDPHVGVFPGPKTSGFYRPNSPGETHPTERPRYGFRQKGEETIARNTRREGPNACILRIHLVRISTMRAIVYGFTL